MLRLLYTSSQTVTLTHANPRIFYVPNSDAIYLASPITNSNRYHKLYRDGTDLDIGDNARIFQTVYYDNIDTKEGVVVRIEGTGLGHIIDPITWVADFNNSIGDALSDVQIENQGLFIRLDSGIVNYLKPASDTYIRYDASTASQLGTVIIKTGANIDSLHYAIDQTIVAFDYTTGDVFFFDIRNEQLLLETTIEVPKTACYDTKYQNVISIRDSDKKVQVYDSTPEPFKISNLSANPGEYKRYQREDVSIIVLGSDDEPVADVDVKWEVFSLTSSGNPINTFDIDEEEINKGSEYGDPLGKITPLFTKTNASGVASAIYCPPGNTFSTGTQEVIVPTVKV